METAIRDGFAPGGAQQHLIRAPIPAVVPTIHAGSLNRPTPKAARAPFDAWSGATGYRRVCAIAHDFYSAVGNPIRRQHLPLLYQTAGAASLEAASAIATA